MICSKRFLLLLVLFLLSSVACFSDVVLTDDEFAELTTIFTRLGNRLDEQAADLSMLEAQLTEAQMQSFEAKRLLAVSQNEIETTKQTLTELKRYYEEQKIEVVIYSVITGVISILAGLVAGLLL